MRRIGEAVKLGTQPTLFYGNGNGEAKAGWFTLSGYEQDLADYSEKILRGIACKYGNNSHEYQMARGIRKSNRKRAVRQSVVLSK